jgi:hypothetical protein
MSSVAGLDLLARFPGARRNGHGWAATCPAHDDRRASLSIGRGDDGRWLLRCHVGCELQAILDKVNLQTRDLFPEPHTTTKKTIVATYDYVDEAGAVLYQAVRYSPKDFKQRRPDGHGGWIWTLGKVRRVLFGLPALTGQKVVYIPEGEKDVLALRALGLTATCNAAGAAKWTADYTAQLTAAGVESVAILPDHDEPGRQHAETIARSCHAAGLQVKIVSLPDLAPKGDVSDWLNAGHTKDQLIALVKATPLYAPSGTDDDQRTERGRVVRLTPASTITPRPVRWLWDGRLALGTFNLLGGREGIGKSIVECTLAADITRGRLPGIYTNRPRSVAIAATEDCWDYTLVPRLMAADADLTRVFRVDVEAAGIETALSLPHDLPDVERRIVEHEVAVLMLDPLLSRLDADLDSHKDAEVRQMLEPLVGMAERTACTVLGLIHVNKSSSSDPLTTLMASRAFVAVARAVLFAMTDPDDEKTRLLGQPKNNLGRLDLPTLSFQINGVVVADTADGPVWTGQLNWTGESERTIRDALQQAAEMSGGNRTVVSEAADWLQDYLASQDGKADSTEIKREGQKAGHDKNALHRARIKLKVATVSEGFPRRTIWTLPQLSHPQSSHSLGRLDTTETTKTTAANHAISNETTGPQSSQSSQLSQSFHTPPRNETTAGHDPHQGPRMAPSVDSATPLKETQITNDDITGKVASERERTRL